MENFLIHFQANEGTKKQLLVVVSMQSREKLSDEAKNSEESLKHKLEGKK